jgi:hypothetical protein
MRAKQTAIVRSNTPRQTIPAGRPGMRLNSTSLYRDEESHTCCHRSSAPQSHSPRSSWRVFVPKAGVGDKLFQTSLPANHVAPMVCGAAVPEASSPTSLVRERGLESPPRLHGQRMQSNQTRAAVGLRIQPIARAAAPKPRPFGVTGESGALHVFGVCSPVCTCTRTGPRSPTEELQCVA